MEQLRMDKMDKSSARNCSPGTVGTKRIQIKLQALVPLTKLFNIRYFKLCNRIILLVVLLSFLTNPVIGDMVQGINTKVVVKNHSVAIGRESFSSKSDIFYNTTSTSVHNHNHNNTGNICLKKEHSIKERDTVEEEGMKMKRRKDRINDKDRNSRDVDGENGKSGSGKTKRKAAAVCGSCVRDRIRTKSLEAIKDSILSKLGMSQPPNITNRSKPKLTDHRLLALLNKRHARHGSNGLYWIVQDDDSEKMQGDEPYDASSSDKVNSENTEFSFKEGEYLRLYGNESGNKYNDYQEGEEDDYHVQTERIVAFAQPHPKIRHLPHVQYFEFSDNLRSSKVKRAVLWLYIKGRESTTIAGNKIVISIYKIIDAGKYGSSGFLESPVIGALKVDSTPHIPSGSGAWIALEYVQIRNLLSEWFRHPQNNFGILIFAEDGNKKNLAVTSHSGNDTAYVPFLEVYVTENRKHRTKRNIGLNCKDSSNETRCCRYPLTVDFVEFGWDWIIAPKQYEAYYCVGECPPVFLPQYPHTHLSQLANTSPNGGPCCAPRKLSDLQMLYFDATSNIVFGRLPDMVVDRCGCA